MLDAGFSFFSFFFLLLFLFGFFSYSIFRVNIKVYAPSFVIGLSLGNVSVMNKVHLDS